MARKACQTTLWYFTRTCIAMPSGRLATHLRLASEPYPLWPSPLSPSTPAPLPTLPGLCEAFQPE